MNETSSAPSVARELAGKQLSTLVPAWQSDLRTTRTAGEVAEIAEFTEMLTLDYGARQAHNFARNVVVNLIGDYQHPDERIQEFVRGALRNMRATWQYALRWLLTAQVYGFAAMEKIWGEANVAGRRAWVYEALVPIKHESLAYRGIVMDTPLAQPRELVQWRQYGEGSAVHIPGAKVVHWSLDDTGDGYGTPLGRAMLPLYRAKRSTQEAWQVAAKYRGYPQIYEVLPTGQLRDEHGQEVSYMDMAAKTWEQVRSGGVVLRPALGGEWADQGLPRVEVLQGASFGDEFSRLVDWVDRAYQLCLGIPALVQLEAQHATRAQSVVHMDAAKFGMLPLAEEFVESCLMRDVVRPLIEVNFGPQDDYGTFPCTIPIDEQYVAQILTALSQAGFLGLMVDRRVYEHWRRVLPGYLPEIAEEEFAPTGA